MKITTEVHVVTIDSPTERRPTWLAVCSYKDVNGNPDFSKSFRNNVEAKIAASEHINTVTLLNELKRGRYQFDEGRI